MPGATAGRPIVLLGAGPFQDLPHRLAMIDLRNENQCVTDTTSSVFGGLGNERVRDALHLLDPVLGSSNFISLVLPFLSSELERKFSSPSLPYPARSLWEVKRMGVATAGSAVAALQVLLVM